MSENEILDYIISNQSDNINNMKLLEIGSWISLEAENKHSPLYGQSSDKIIGELMTLILDEIKIFPKLDSYGYESASGLLESIFAWATFNYDVTIKSEDMIASSFLNTTFNGGITIDSKIIYDSVFYDCKINCNVYVNDGCTDLEDRCFGADWGSNSSLSLPSSIKFMDPSAFFSWYWKLPPNIYFRGSIDKFDDLMMATEESVNDFNSFKPVLPRTVMCVDDTWDLEEYFKRRTIK